MDTCLIITWRTGERAVLPDLPEEFGWQLFRDFRTSREVLPSLYSLRLLDQSRPGEQGNVLELWSRDEAERLPPRSELSPDRFLAAARNAVRMPVPARLPAEDELLVDEHRRDQERPDA